MTPDLPPEKQPLVSFPSFQPGQNLLYLRLAVEEAIKNKLIPKENAADILRFIEGL